MVDVVDSRTRSLMMSGIKSKNTKPELLVRKALHAAGFRYRLHDRRLPGKPDIVLPKYRAVIFVHGCFWHGHDCHLFKWPKTNVAFWKDKIGGNIERDNINVELLKNLNWRYIIVWECAIKGRRKKSGTALINSMAIWLKSDLATSIIDGEEI